MTCISTIDIQTRLDVQELLSHFAHFLDHDRGPCWADLFTNDGVFECPDGSCLTGAAELASLPTLVAEKGRGSWRHLITQVIVERRRERKELAVRAYCPVIDMDNSTTLAAFYDFEFVLRFASRWRISHALARRVGNGVDASVGAAALADAARSRIALQ